MAIPPPDGGEKVANPLTSEQIEFLSDVARPNMDATQDNDTLKNFADVWWNLCQWEKQRADVLDGKAQTLIGMATIAGTVVTVAVPVIGANGPGAVLRVASVFCFLLASVLAVGSLQVKDYGGFLDGDVFGALTIGKQPPGLLPPLKDTDPFRSYLREIVMQRWLIYSGFKKVSAQKTGRIAWAQNLVLIAVGCLLLSVVLAAKSLL